MNLESIAQNKKIPVILDTDIGTDIDDTWALALLLKCPELDVKLITTASGDTTERAKIVAKLLEIAKRIDIPIGIGLPLEPTPCFQQQWTKDYKLQSFPGMIFENGISAITNTILCSSEPITVISIGPLTNLASAILFEPEIMKNSSFVGMFGSLRKGYFGKVGAAAEYNVKLFPHACRKVFSSSWKKTIAPLDTSGVVQLKGEKYQAIRECKDVLTQAVVENYECWAKYYVNPLYKGFDPCKESSILYDLVPIYLSFSEKLLGIENLAITVSDEGYTTIDNTGEPIRCATAWNNLAAFEDLVVSRLTT